MTSASTPLRVPPAEDEDYERRRQALIADLQAGLDQIERGEVLEGDEVFDELIRTFHQRHPYATE
jgi:predicted transcriptional regulator